MEITKEILAIAEEHKKLTFVPEIQRSMSMGVDVQSLAYQHSFVYGYNLALNFIPELMITVEEFNVYVSQALGLASQGLAS